MSGKKTALDRRLRAEARAARVSRLTRWERFKRRAGWPLCAIGLALFGATFVANFAGVRLLPFDQHHFFGQAGGMLLAFTGLRWATA